MTTGDTGSGVLLSFGGAAEAHTVGRAPFHSAFAHATVGYSWRLPQFRVEMAILPSVGDVSWPTPSVQAGPAPWIRESLRARLWHVLIEAEHGRTVSPPHEYYWDVSLCAGAQLLPISSCTSIAFVGQDSPPASSVTQISLSLGLGGVYTKTESKPWARSKRVVTGSLAAWTSGFVTRGFASSPEVSVAEAKPGDAQAGARRFWDSRPGGRVSAVAPMWGALSRGAISLGRASAPAFA